ncbi:MAG TPA: phosphoribosylformylglycinamidine cyclo-ligase [Acidimicrobiales bacterium]|nr:phosphoribosylformylglycinamidine cyclo-ligase [Acidimicrobiales bacterium]
MSDPRRGDSRPGRGEPGRSDGGPPVAPDPGGGLTYADAGVDISAGEAAVERIKARVRTTFRPEVIGDIGGFGGLFAFAAERYRSPVLVASTDGVGTKALVAQATGRFATIGIDLVAMCVDDVVCQGAEPLFFLDYIAVGLLDPGQVEQLVQGVVEGCRQAGCALVGGEMAEHPGAMEPGEFDLVGSAVGVAERDRLVTGARVRAGDVLLGLPSHGLRCNGYSLARRVLLEDAALSLEGPAYQGAGRTLADELLAPSLVYAPAVMKLLGRVDVRALAHVTGGGIPGNLARVLPPDVDAVVDRSRWQEPRIFAEVRRLGGIHPDEMARVFNLGIGMIAVVAPADEGRAVEVLSSAGFRAAAVGEVVPGSGEVHLVSSASGRAGDVSRGGSGG